MFAQYILTPLAFTYLIILLAYLVKIVAGAEWPSGWVGWLVASVSVTGILGFLLVHPLRGDPAEGWIRSYGRWLFVGLVPAALMLLVAFCKRIVPYGLTEHVVYFKGTPQSPADRNDVHEKFSLLTRNYPREKMDEIFTRLQDIEAETNFDWLKV